MTSWAAIAKAAPAAAAPASEEAADASNIKYAVIDANAIINGLDLNAIAAKLVTIQEVMDEIRDKRSRQNIATLPRGIDVREPTEESVKAGKSPHGTASWLIQPAACGRRLALLVHCSRLVPAR